MPLKFNQANAFSLSLSLSLSISLSLSPLSLSLSISLSISLSLSLSAKFNMRHLLFACWVLFRAAIRAPFYSLFALRALINNAESFITLLLVKFKYLPNPHILDTGFR